MSVAGTSQRGAGKHMSADTVSSCWIHLTPLPELQTVQGVSASPIGATAYSEQLGSKHSISDVFPNNLACQDFGTVGLLLMSSMKAFYDDDFIMYFSSRLNPSHHSLQLFGRYCKRLFPVKPQQCLRTKKLIRTFHRHNDSIFIFVH